MANSNNYMRKYVAYRYLLLKLKVIKYKGGACQICGYNKCHGSLVLHHRDPSEKEFTWAKLRKQSWATIQREADKCDLLCANCHGEIHHDPTVLEKAVAYMEEKRHASQRSSKVVALCETLI